MKHLTSWPLNELIRLTMLWTTEQLGPEVSPRNTVISGKWGVGGGTGASDIVATRGDPKFCDNNFDGFKAYIEETIYKPKITKE